MSESRSRKSDVNGRENINGSAGRPGEERPSSKVRLDVEKLHSLPSEQQDLYIFTFSVEMENFISELDYEALCAQQEPLNVQLFQVLSLSSPTPSKAVRTQLGRAYARILGKGNRKTLFETVNRLVSVIGTGKGEKDIQNKHAAAYCLGEVYKAAGDSAINLSSLACSTLLRLLKSAQNHAGLRAAIFGALGKIIGSIQGSTDESIARDIWKSGRNVAASDKAALVQARACGCLEHLIKGTSYFDNVSDFENIKTTIWKVSEVALAPARHAAASCLAAAFQKAYSETAVSKNALKSKKSRKPQRTQSAVIEEAAQEISRPESPSNTKKVSMKLELSLFEILRQLSSQYHRPTTNQRTRATIAHCYIMFFRSLKPQLIETAYKRILDHLLSDLLNHPSLTYDRHKLLLSRKFVHRILTHCIGSKILGESGRLDAARTIINDVLKNYPQVIKEAREPSKHALVCALDALAALITSLGSAFRSLAESSREALLQVLQHSSYTVQVHAANCLRTFVLMCPQQLLSCATISMNCLNRELGLLGGPKQSPRRCVGYANGLASVLGISTSQPLYSSLEICARTLTTATDLLKSSSQADLRVAGIQVQVAWILIGGLMTLGPAFVKIHLSQFLLLWRNALPKPLTKDNTAQRSSVEITYLTHVRECTLGSILLFLEYNNRLVTGDVAKRIANMLQNTSEYLDNFPFKKNFDDTSQRTISSLSMQELVLMVQRRVLQCYARLISFNPGASSEIVTQSNLVISAMRLFADPEAYSHGSLGSSIANAAGTFESIWDVADNTAFGLTGLVRGNDIAPLPGEQPLSRDSAVGHGMGNDLDLDSALSTPVLGAQEHDSIYLHRKVHQRNDELPDPPATEVINSAITVFAVALPLQIPRVQEGVLEQMATFLASPILLRDPGRKAAVTVNTAMALLGALKVAVGETIADNGDLKHHTVEKILEEILRTLLADQDPNIRHIAYEGLGRLCNSSGNAFTANEVNGLIDTIVSNRDPHARAGCAMGLGSIHHQVGGMAAGLHLKKIHGILMSLCSDPSPVVHRDAIEALSRVADSAGLTYSAYVTSNLGLLAQLWTCDTHNEESPLVTTSNAEIESPTAVAIAHCVDSLINVLGPDLQDMTKARTLMLTLMKQFDQDPLTLVQVNSLKAWEHTYLYDPIHVDSRTYVHRIQSDLDSHNDQIKENAIDGLYNLMRKDADRVISVAVDGLEDQIWQVLNNNPESDGIRNVVQSWLAQSSLSDTEKWILRCQQVLTKTTITQVDVAPPPEPKPAGPDLQDEEVAGFAASENKDQNTAGATEITRELLRWQVRSFAMQCLCDLVAMIGKDMDLNPESPAGQALQNRIADVIRLAFLASTASVTQLQVSGLRLINQILKIFGTTPDPDFQEALLLEQYQAQISSALTPAFAADSSPDLASGAVDVCATFVSAGLVTDVERMGRILKLLVTALESFTDDSQDSAVGELRGLSSNAQTMVRMAVLSAWAELQVASTQQEYLVKVMKPHVAKLTPLWLSSLQEFARLRFEPDISNSTGPARFDESLDVVYAALNRQTLLKFYQDSWLKLVDAIASLIDQDSEFVFDALDGRVKDGAVNGVTTEKNNINYRAEPAAFFFVLFGIVIEALTTRSSNDAQNSESQTLEILSALKRILRPSVSGQAVFQDTVFSETVELFDRLALTEGLDVQQVIVDIARNLCVTHPAAKKQDDVEEHLTDDIEQLFELTRIMVLVLAGILPNLAEQNPSARHQLPDEAIILIQTTLEALADVADIFPSVIKTDLQASIFHVFSTILGTGLCQANVVPQALPVFRRFLRSIVSQHDPSSSNNSADLVRGCLRRFLKILAHAQRRESESALPCAKNTILACTILLTTASSVFAPSDTLISKALDDILDCLQDLGLAVVAANCLRSIIATNTKNETDQTIARHLLPHLLRFTVDTSERDPEDVRSLTAQALTSFVSTTTSDEAGSAAMCIVIPALLTRAAAEGKDKYPETAKRLLELAGGRMMPVFRGVVGKMSAEQRSFMETVIREGGSAGRGGPGARRGSALEKEEPKIALKMNFGG